MPPLIKAFDGYIPELGPDVFLADNAVVVGHVEIGAGVSVWYSAVIRGDRGRIRIGAHSAIQDLVCIHMRKGGAAADIGEHVSIGQGVIIHGAQIGDGVLIGHGSIVMNGAQIGEQAVISAGSLVARRTVIPPRTLARGRPAKVIRDLTESEWKLGKQSAERHNQLAERA